MLRQIRRNRPGILGGALVYLIFVVVQLVVPSDWFNIIRERGFDAVLWSDLQFRASPHGIPEVIVVDIDRPSLAALGNWPWSRSTMAQLVSAISAGKPIALGIDVLFAGQDPRSPATATPTSEGTVPGASSHTPLDGDR